MEENMFALGIKNTNNRDNSYKHKSNKPMIQKEVFDISKVKIEKSIFDQKEIKSQQNASSLSNLNGNNDASFSKYLEYQDDIEEKQDNQQDQKNDENQDNQSQTQHSSSISKASFPNFSKNLQFTSLSADPKLQKDNRSDLLGKEENKSNNASNIKNVSTLTQNEYKNQSQVQSSISQNSSPQDTIQSVLKQINDFYQMNKSKSILQDNEVKESIILIKNFMEQYQDFQFDKFLNVKFGKRIVLPDFNVMVLINEDRESCTLRIYFMLAEILGIEEENKINIEENQYIKSINKLTYSDIQEMLPTVEGI